MESATLFLLAADAILLLHFLFVVFVVLGLLMILVGAARGWNWIRNPWFRLSHLVAIGVVVIQSWLGVICPLTTVEVELRTQAGELAYSGSFVAHWIETILYLHLPWWLFLAGYTAFGSAVLATWFLVRPHGFGRSI